jgi:glycerophosphoryl diester phosphodiesterase
MLLKTGHRGAMGYAPENTLKSFKKALELGVDMVELDVHLTQDKKLVVIHDETLERTTNGKGAVSKKTLKQLKTLDAGEGEQIPTLEEVFDLIDKRIQINIELKGENTAKPVFELIENYVKNKGWDYSHFLISSFDFKELKNFRKLTSKIKIGTLIKKLPINYPEIIDKLKANVINLNFQLITPELITKIHQKNLKVFVWTVNNSVDINKMKKLKVDGIFSNFPDKI